MRKAKINLIKLRILSEYLYFYDLNSQILPNGKDDHSVSQKTNS
jgi:hypothetical protein